MDFDEHDEGEDQEMILPPATTIGSTGERKPVSVGETGGNGGGGGGKYRECLKNHALSIGGHAVDGCGEFMPAGEEGTLESLRCAACNCHRNFHRKESEVPHHHQQQFSSYYQSTPAAQAAGLFQQHPHYAAAAVAAAAGGIDHRPLALPSTSAGHSRDIIEHEEIVGGAVAGASGSAVPGSKKRFRTKFTQEQKDKMLAFAEKIGWRIQKHDEAAVQEFCSENSIKRHVLKVWMHNNKHTLGKKP